MRSRAVGTICTFSRRIKSRHTCGCFTAVATEQVAIRAGARLLDTIRNLVPSRCWSRLTMIELLMSPPERLLFPTKGVRHDSPAQFPVRTPAEIGGGNQIGAIAR